MIIDFHTHAFPGRIAPRAMEKLSRDAGGLVPHTDGTLESLKEEMVKDGIDISVVHSIATNPRQQASVNNFAMEMDKDPAIVAFGSIHPDAPDALEELERIHAAGLKGVKLHPEYQQFYADDEKMRPIYRKISQLGLITIFHAGYDYGFPPPYHAMPENLLRPLDWLESPVVAAHWGGLDCGAQVLDKLCGRDIYFDLSYGYGCIPKPIAQRILDKHSPDRLLFGSDMPWHRPEWELRLIRSLDISDADREKILWRNACILLSLEEK
jgi:predicted TIM-barrel fold metal-dependent hydrolase